MEQMRVRQRVASNIESAHERDEDYNNADHVEPLLGDGSMEYPLDHNSISRLIWRWR